MVSERVQRQIDRLLDEAEAAMAELHWDVVMQRSQAALALQPENPDANTYLEAANKALDNGTASVQPAESSATAKAVSEVAPTAEPTSFSDGRYVVKRFLGEGGKKIVYLAHDELLDRDIAFALIKSEGLDDISRERITREAQAMGRLGSHPHIVTVLDLGETPSTVPGQPGQPYMVIELLAGGDVEVVVEDAPDHKLPLEQAIRIAIETCRGLEFAHSKGIIHRDLKPGNVWLTADGTAKIGDFGLAVALDRSRLTQQGMMVGTVSYMPPEQAMGGEVTPKADLYSLGAMPSAVPRLRQHRYHRPAHQHAGRSSDVAPLRLPPPSGSPHHEAAGKRPGRKARLGSKCTNRSGSHRSCTVSRRINFYRRGGQRPGLAGRWGVRWTAGFGRYSTRKLERPLPGFSCAGSRTKVLWQERWCLSFATTWLPFSSSKQKQGAGPSGALPSA
jgi:hypothetical protein